MNKLIKIEDDKYSIEYNEKTRIINRILRYDEDLTEELNYDIVRDMLFEILNLREQNEKLTHFFNLVKEIYTLTKEYEWWKAGIGVVIRVEEIDDEIKTLVGVNKNKIGEKANETNERINRENRVCS